MNVFSESELQFITNTGSHLAVNAQINSVSTKSPLTVSQWSSPRLPFSMTSEYSWVFAWREWKIFTCCIQINLSISKKKHTRMLFLSTFFCKVSMNKRQFFLCSGTDAYQIQTAHGAVNTLTQQKSQGLLNAASKEEPLYASPIKLNTAYNLMVTGNKPRLGSTVASEGSLLKWMGYF